MYQCALTATEWDLKPNSPLQRWSNVRSTKFTKFSTVTLSPLPEGLVGTDVALVFMAV